MKFYWYRHPQHMQPIGPLPESSARTVWLDGGFPDVSELASSEYPDHPDSDWQPASSTFGAAPSRPAHAASASDRLLEHRRELRKNSLYPGSRLLINVATVAFVVLSLNGLDEDEGDGSAVIATLVAQLFGIALLRALAMAVFDAADAAVRSADARGSR